MSFDYERLPRDYPRRFLPPKIDLAEWSNLEPIFDDLEKRSLGTRGDLERWLDYESEFASAFLEEYVVRYIRMTCQTNDLERENAYLHFVENIEPKAKVRFHELDHRFFGSPARKQLTSHRFSVLERKKENSVALFRKENVELEAEETKLAQRYQKIVGGMTLPYDGREHTLQQMARYLEEPKRDRRKETWELAERRRLKDHESIEQIFDEQIALRDRIARNAGFQNYRDYAFRKRERFDYNPEDCIRFHEAVAKHVVPLIRLIDEERKMRLGVDQLRPWDLVVDPTGQPPLQPFKTALELTEGCAKIFDHIDTDFARNFRKISDLGLLDLESRSGKAPGGYDFELWEVRLPFIFMNGVGRDGDVYTLLHESGHAFHTFATREKDYHFLYRGENIPTEFAEVASMAMELLGSEHLNGTFYDRQDALRSHREHLISVTRGLAWIATIDAFQHWIYTNLQHTHEERQEYWIKLRDRFGGIESWERYEDERRFYWQRQLHLFTHPFYYIEYGIAQLGALGIWTHYLKDAHEAVSAYKRGLALGGSEPLPELFEAAGLPFNFGPERVEPYVRQLRGQILQM